MILRGKLQLIFITHQFTGTGTADTAHPPPKNLDLCVPLLCVNNYDERCIQLCDASAQIEPQELGAFYSKTHTLSHMLLVHTAK